MPSTPLLGIPIPTLPDSDNVPKVMADAFDKAETFWVGRYASAADRDSKVTGPIDGMMCYLTSPGTLMMYRAANGGWEDVFNPNPWKTYLPILQSTSGQSYVNNGSGAGTNGRYYVWGNTVWFQINIRIGANIICPPGQLVMTMPPGITGASAISHDGPANLYNPAFGTLKGNWGITPGGNVFTLAFPYLSTANPQWMGNFVDSTDGSSPGTGVPLIPNGFGTGFPLQPNGFLTLSGTFETN